MPQRPLVSRRALTLVGAGLLGTGAVALGWTLSDLLLRARPVRRKRHAAQVLSVTQEGEHTTYRLSRSLTSARRGAVTVNWDDERGGQLLGSPSAQGLDWVERPLLAGEATLMPTDSVRLSSLGLGSPRERGLTYREVSLIGEHGALPAWFIPAQDDWVIVVHGHQGLRQDALRFLPAYHRLGLSSLAVTYRNAQGAARTPQGLYRLGAGEWRDLEAAVRYAKSQGARRILIMGLSMGGSITLNFLRLSPLASAISGVVLDSPALDWPAIVQHHARRLGLSAAAGAVERLIGWRIGQKLSDLRVPSQALKTPLLLFHGSADSTVPAPQAERLYRERPDLVDYVRVEGGEHLRLWNVNPAAYEAHLERFVRRVLSN